MLVKCRICGEKIDRDIAYKRVINGKNFYYHSEKEFQEEENKKLQRNQTYSLMCNIFGVKDILNTVLWKEYNEWLKVADASKINDYLGENKEYLSKVINRLDRNEYARIRYVSAVLKNGLVDYKPKKVEETKIFGISITEEHYETKYKPRKRKALIDFEEEYNE